MTKATPSISHTKSTTHYIRARASDLLLLLLFSCLYISVCLLFLSKHLRAAIVCSMSQATCGETSASARFCSLGGNTAERRKEAECATHSLGEKRSGMRDAFPRRSREARRIKEPPLPPLENCDFGFRSKFFAGGSHCRHSSSAMPKDDHRRMITEG